MVVSESPWQFLARLVWKSHSLVHSAVPFNHMSYGLNLGWGGDPIGGM